MAEQGAAEPPEPPLPAASLPGQATRAVYRVSQTVRFSMDVSKMLMGLSPESDGEVELNNPRAEVLTKTSGLLEWQLLPHPKETLVRLRWKDTGSELSYPGTALTSAEQQQLSAQTMRQLDGVEVYAHLSARNRLFRLRVAQSLPPHAWPRLLNLMELINVTVPRQPPEEWNAEEVDSFGKYNGTYIVESRQGQTLLLNKRKHYQEITNAGSSLSKQVGLKEKHVKNLGKARIRFGLEERRVVAAEGRFHTEIRHSLVEADSDVSYSVQPAGLEAMAEAAPRSAVELERLLASLVEVDPREVPSRAAGPAVARPGLVGLSPKEFERKLRDVVSALQGLPGFDAHSEAAQPLLDDLSALFSTDPDNARRVLRQSLVEDKVSGEVMAAVVTESLRHGAAGQGLAADMLGTPNLPEECYSAALAGLGTLEKLEAPGRAALLRTLKGELKTLPQDIAINAPLLAGYQGYQTRQTEGDAGEWFDVLLEALDRAKTPEQQEVILLGLGNIGDPRLLAISEPYLTSPHGHVRLAAVSSLRRVEDPVALGRIFTAFNSDPSVEVRLGIVDLFGELGPLELVLAQVGASMTPRMDAAVRKKTLVVLAERTQSREFVSRFLSDAEPNIQELAKAMLGQF